MNSNANHWISIENHQIAMEVLSKSMEAIQTNKKKRARQTYHSFFNQIAYQIAVFFSSGNTSAILKQNHTFTIYVLHYIMVIRKSLISDYIK